MATIRQIFFLCTIHFYCSAQSNDLIISEYVEGSSNNKAIELYNGTTGEINLKDSSYILDFYFNGNVSSGTRLVLDGKILPGATFVIAHPQATFLSTNGGPITAQQTSSSSWFNGDDAITLKKTILAETIIDAIGIIGADPGTEWGRGLLSSSDNTLRRKSEICFPKGSLSEFDPAIEWEGYEIDFYEGLGTHESRCQSGQALIKTEPGILEFSSIMKRESIVKKVTLTIQNLQEDLQVTAPAGFLVAANLTDQFTPSMILPLASFTNGSSNFFVRFFSDQMDTIASGINLQSGEVEKRLSVKGVAFTDQRTPVYKIQGNTGSSALTGHLVITNGVVTAAFQQPNELNGFYLQDTLGDGSAETSDGIFIYNTDLAVKEGDFLQITGEVAEYNGLTEIKNVTVMARLAAGKTLNDTAAVTFPLTQISDLEPYEGMLVQFPQELMVVDNYNLARYGELQLAFGGRTFTPTEIIDPNDANRSGLTYTGKNNAAAVQEFERQNVNRTVLLDNGSYSQNQLPIPYLDESNRTIRVGSTLRNITGIVDYAFGSYRIQPSHLPAIQYALRPAVPPKKEGLRIASFNMLNFFNGNGEGSGFPTPRGASSLVEFQRQKIKHLAALQALDADLYGFMEVENDGESNLSAIAQLVYEMNVQAGSAKYDFIRAPNFHSLQLGTDAIKVAMVYNTAKLSPAGTSMIDTNQVHNRPPLAQLFSERENGNQFVVVVNHFKSKSCADAAGADLDQQDGQACYNARRKLQATALIKWVDSLQQRLGCTQVVLLGDFNSYKQEDPLDLLRHHGYTDIASTNYSYIFGGRSGTLDHFLFSPAMIPSVADVSEWHINADEPQFKDYNVESVPVELYASDAYRSSDHDPAIATINATLTSYASSPSRKVNLIRSFGGHAYFEIPSGMLSPKIQLTNLAGQIIAVEAQKIDNERWQISTAHVPMGLYILTATSCAGVSRCKLWID